MIKKSLLIGLIAALFVPAYINAAAEPIATKPTLLIVCCTLMRSDLQNIRFPYDDFINLVTRLLPDFNIRTVTLPQIPDELLNLRNASYVLFAVFTNDSYTVDHLKQLFAYYGFNSLKEKAYVLLAGQHGREATNELFLKSFKQSFRDSFTLNWRSSEGEQTAQVFQPNEKFTEFLKFLKSLGPVLEKHAK